jgi:hypothetical protein
MLATSTGAKNLTKDGFSQPDQASQESWTIPATTCWRFAVMEAEEIADQIAMRV